MTIEETERLVYDAFVEVGYILPTTVEQVPKAEEQLKNEPLIELPERLKKLYDYS